jgi:hypothetical protein
MLRLYQWLRRRASLLFWGGPRVPGPGQATSRRVVTVECEERTVLFQAQAKSRPLGRHGIAEKGRVVEAQPSRPDSDKRDRPK